MISRLINKIKILLSNIYFFIRSLFWKRDPKIVVLGSWFGEKFSDNSRFLFQYLCENKEKLSLDHVVWITKNKCLNQELNTLGYESYLFGSEESKFYHKKAKYHIICNSSNSSNADIETIYSHGAIRINLWHGIGVVKRFGKASLAEKRLHAQHPFIYSFVSKLIKTSFYRNFLFYRGGWGDFYLLSTSSISEKQFQESFGYVPCNRFIQATYPRTHLSQTLLTYEKKVLDMIKEHKKIILYLPTFRAGSTSEECLNFSSKLEDCLKQENILWIQKAHSASSKSISNKFEENIISLPSDFEINLLLPHITLLVTDYSSVATDARFFYKPVIFYMPDYEDYKNGANGLTDEADELLSGPQFFTFEDFKRKLPYYAANPSLAIPSNFEEIRNKYWGKSNSIADVWNKISKI